VPDYEITMAGRIGPAVESCLPGFRSVVPPATVLRAVASNQGGVLKLLGMLADHHLTLIDVRINPAPTCPTAIPARRPQPPAEPTESTAGVTFSGSRSGDLRATGVVAGVRCNHTPHQWGRHSLPDSIVLHTD